MCVGGNRRPSFNKILLRKERKMGYKDKQYQKSLHQQAYDKMRSMQAFGESKKEAIANGTAKEKIFSYNTYQTYWKHTKYFLDYVKENYPDCKSIKKAKKYTKEWLEYRASYTNEAGEHLSAWTIQTEAKALAKLYGIEQGDSEYFEPPIRRREDIKRSRMQCKRDKDFSITNNDELIRFCRGVGARRSGLGQIRGKDLVSKDSIVREVKRLNEVNRTRELSAKESKNLTICKDALLFGDVTHFVYLKEKGGRERLSPIIGPDAKQIVERFERTGKDGKVWIHIPSHADIHSYRGDYATAIYKMYARPIVDIPYDKTNPGTGKRYQSQVYCCRKDEKGKRLDKRAMFLASKALGHNRIEIVANNYIRGL